MQITYKKWNLRELTDIKVPVVETSKPEDKPDDKVDTRCRQNRTKKKTHT